VKARSDKEASQKAFKNMGIADRHRKTMPHTVKKVGEETVSEESPAEDNLSSSYKAKFAAMLKKTGKSLADMSDEDKKKFFNSVDAAHTAKNEAYDTPAVKKPVSQMTPAEKKKNDERRTAYNTFQKRKRDNEKAVKDMKTMAPHMKNPAFGESVEEGAMSRIDYQQKSGEKGTGLSTFKKKPAPKNTMVASPKTQRVKMTTAKAAERMVKKGAVYAEDAVEDTIDEASAYADARRAMRADSKGMAPIKKSGGTKTYKGKEAGEEKHGGHIVMQLRKAISINKPVKFKDGTTHQVSKAHAHKFLSKYNAGKPQEKENMHSGHASHADFMKHVS
jgi:hypothetical protein